MYENGPHVTVPQGMLLPIYRGGTLGKWTASLGLLAYDRLAGVKRSERRRMLSAEEALAMVPHLKRDGLLGACYYAEYRTDDARLTIEVLKRAEEEAAVTPADFFQRRTGMMLFDYPAVKRHKDAVIRYMAGRAGWSEAETAAHAADLARAMEEATVAVEREDSAQPDPR